MSTPASSSSQVVAPNPNQETTDTPVGAERRRARRYPCNGYAEAVVIHPESLFRGAIQDISQTGCFVATKANLHVQPESDIDLRFVIDDHHYRTYARVVEVRPGKGVGLLFPPAEEQTEEWLQNLLRILSAMPPPKKK